MQHLTGRKQEIQLLNKALSSPDAELIAVYGRRRVGKTYLIRTVFEKETLLELTGQKGVSLASQLENFSLTLSTVFQLPVKVATPKSWVHAFHVLIQLLKDRLETEKKVLFFDEFPWFDTPRSGFLAAFDHFWNSWASKQHRLVVVVCGSAASWMIRNIVRNKGGLHNRITRRMRLMPFTLGETEQFLQSRGIHFDRYSVLQLYMVMGGIPHYLKEIERGESVEQAIGRICFSKDGLLRDEFNSLYTSLFDDAEKHVAIVKALAAKPGGMSRNEISEALNIPSGGTLTKIISELLESGFVADHIPFGKTSNHVVYRLNDEFSLFHLKFIDGSKSKKAEVWSAIMAGPSWRTWSALMFENVCLKHTVQIKKALSIAGIYSEESVWRQNANSDVEGAQIDLLIDRNDQCINIVEAKFSKTELLLTKKQAEEISRKRRIFMQATQTKKTVFITLLSTYGATMNEHFVNTVQSQLTMNELFEDT